MKRILDMLKALGGFGILVWALSHRWLGRNTLGAEWIDRWMCGVGSLSVWISVDYNNRKSTCTMIITVRQSP